MPPSNKKDPEMCEMTCIQGQTTPLHKLRHNHKMEHQKNFFSNVLVQN